MRRVYGGLAFLCVVVIVYVSLRPFTFTPATWKDTSDEFMEFTFRRPIRLIDVLRNVVALVPLGFFMAAALDPDGRRDRAVRRGLGIVAFATLQSMALEAAQAFVRIRIVSGRDVVAQALGCACGVIAWAMVGSTVATSIGRFTASRTNRHEVHQ